MKEEAEEEIEIKHNQLVVSCGAEGVVIEQTSMDESMEILEKRALRILKLLSPVKEQPDHYHG